MPKPKSLRLIRKIKNGGYSNNSRMKKSQIAALVALIIILSIGYLLLIAVRDYTELGSYSESFVEQQQNKQNALELESEEIAEFADPQVVAIIEAYRQLEYAVAAEVSDEFTQLVASAYRDEILVTADELTVDDDKFVIVTAPTREYNQEFCGLYGQQMCFILHDDGEMILILNIMDFLVREQTFEPDFEFDMNDPLFANMSGAHWMLEDYIEDDEVLLVSSGMGDAGTSSLLVHAIDLATTEIVEVVVAEASYDQPTILYRDDFKLLINFEYEPAEDDLNHHFGTIENEDGDILAEIDEVNEDYLSADMIDLIDTYEHDGEIWFTLFDQQYSFDGDKLRKE